MADKKEIEQEEAWIGDAVLGLFAREWILQNQKKKNFHKAKQLYQEILDSNPNFLEAMSVVNATRDSAIADSLFIGEQLVKLRGKEFLVDVDESFGFEYDTTFGIKSFRKDTLLDTILQISIFSHEK